MSTTKVFLNTKFQLIKEFIMAKDSLIYYVIVGDGHIQMDVVTEQLEFYDTEEAALKALKYLSGDFTVIPVKVKRHYENP